MKAKNRLYSATIVMQPHLNEAKQAEELEKVKKQIEAEGMGEVQNVIHMGQHSLAYPMRKATTGVYVRVFYTTSPTRIKGINHSLRMNEHFLRTLNIEETQPEPKKLAEKVHGNEKE